MSVFQSNHDDVLTSSAVTYTMLSQKINICIYKKSDNNARLLSDWRWRSPSCDSINCFFADQKCCNSKSEQSVNHSRNRFFCSKKKDIYSRDYCSSYNLTDYEWSIFFFFHSQPCRNKISLEAKISVFDYDSHTDTKSKCCSKHESYSKIYYIHQRHQDQWQEIKKKLCKK